jgi:hypothetical protein
MTLPINLRLINKVWEKYMNFTFDLSNLISIIVGVLVGAVSCKFFAIGKNNNQIEIHSNNKNLKEDK